MPSLGWEDPLEKEMATHSSSRLGKPVDRGAWQATGNGVEEVATESVLVVSGTLFLTPPSLDRQYHQ